MGFIQNSTRPPDILNTKRVLTIRAFYHQGSYYFRTREITDMIRAKQPFSIVQRCRKRYGEDSVLSGRKTEAFRDPVEDQEETTFMAGSTVIKYLSDIKAKTPIVEDLLKEIRSYQRYAERSK